MQKNQQRMKGIAVNQEVVVARTPSTPLKGELIIAGIEARNVLNFLRIRIT